jgi:hypothetical protein
MGFAPPTRNFRADSGNYVRVLYMGRAIGTCRISKNPSGKVFGDFNLSEDADADQFVLYSVSHWNKSIPQLGLIGE